MCASLIALFWVLRVLWAIIVILTAILWMLFALARLQKVLSI